MMTEGSTAASAGTRTLHPFEFHGSGGEYFGIWIVNLALTIITLGIYGAWAKVRTMRYFRGNTFVAGHPFDYHASPVRILIGRAILFFFLVCYEVSARFSPIFAGVWGFGFLFIVPWLVVSSLRFNARNTSYRNVRFNFEGTMGEAARAYILWPFLSILTLFTTWPLVHRTRDYFYINNHTFGGRNFHTEFSGWRIYAIFLAGFGLFVAASAALSALVAAVIVPLHLLVPNAKPSPTAIAIFLAAYLVFVLALTAIQSFVHALTMNLALNNTTLDNRHALRSQLGPVRMSWIVFTNLLLVLVTLGLYYPWARVRLARYEISCLAVLAASDLDEFTSEAVGRQGAIGEEIASYFDLGISL